MRMRRLVLVQAAVIMLAACTGPTAERSPPQSDATAKATVVPPEHHDVSPPLREIPPTPRPPDDMKHEIPIHRLPLPPAYR
jgi:hypothetical protein